MPMHLTLSLRSDANAFLPYLLTSSTPKCRPTACPPAPPTLLLPYRLLLLLLLLRLPLSPLILLPPQRRKGIICKSARILRTGSKRQDRFVMWVQVLLLPILRPKAVRPTVAAGCTSSLALTLTLFLLLLPSTSATCTSTAKCGC